MEEREQSKMELLEELGRLERQNQALAESHERLQALARAHLAVSTELIDARLDVVLRTIVDQARALTGAQFAALCINDHPDGAQPWVYSGALPPRLDGERSFLVVPVKLRGDSIGNLYLTGKRGGEGFSAGDQWTIETLAGEIGPAVELARLHEAQASERERLAFLLEVGTQLSESLDYDVVLARVAQLLVPRLADCCVVYLQEQGTARPASFAVGNPARSSLLRLAFEDGSPIGPQHAESPIGRAYARGEPVFLPVVDAATIAAEWQDPAAQRLVTALGVRSLLALPITVEDRVFGVMKLVYCEPPRQYSESDLLLARAVSHRAALAMENARLFLKAREALRSRDDVLAFVAHDLRNPLAAVYTLAQLLQRRTANAEDRTLVGNLLRSVLRMDGLVNDLLDAAALDAGQLRLEPEPVPLVELTTEALAGIEHAAAEHGLRLEQALPAPADAYVVQVDRRRVLQVLANLLGNALKFTPAGGTLRVSARRDGEHIEVAVTDTGPGIPEAQRAHLFERYWKGRGQGTGLGLYIARRIVGAHGGRMWVDSDTGMGATFRFTLPAA